MGIDKSLLLLDGLPLACRVASALTAGGATSVTTIGGDGTSLQALGLRFVADQHPGDGPLGGIITALRNASEPIVVVSATDMPFLNAINVTPLVDALGVDDDARAAVGTADGHPEPLHAAWRVSALPELEAAFAAGERSPRRLLAVLPHALVELGGGAWSVDMDTPTR